MWCGKSSSKSKVHSDETYFRKQERSKINKPTLQFKEPKSSQEPDDGVQIMIKTLPLSVLELQHPWRVKRHILHAEGQSDKLGRRKMSSESSQEINFCFPIELSHLRKVSRASLVAQWLRICLPMQGTRFEPWSGKIPHAAEQLGPWATITESARLEPVLRNKRGRDSERPAHRDEEWPPLATAGESPRTETNTQHSHK